MMQVPYRFVPAVSLPTRNIVRQDNSGKYSNYRHHAVPGGLPAQLFQTDRLSRIKSSGDERQHTIAIGR